MGRREVLGVRIMQLLAAERNMTKMGDI